MKLLTRLIIAGVVLALIVHHQNAVPPRPPVQHCMTGGHLSSAACLERLVPAAHRPALDACLIRASHAGWTSFRDHGAQACVTGAS